MPKPLALTDSQMSTVMNAAAVLTNPLDRSAFLVALAAALRDEREIGDGILGRTIRRLQREYFRPPLVKTENNTRRVVGDPIL
jgi:hypothetical protein